GSIERVKMVVEKCKERNLKIRIGVNGGSLEKELLKKYGSATAALSLSNGDTRANTVVFLTASSSSSSLKLSSSSPDITVFSSLHI
ncbi:flavodoxin-dependent (E)-4-hydroxy-3-methylbut-2-enyl-diphosphate synthase, partial [Clostridioides difficile]